MERSSSDAKARDWYSVSVDTLRAWGIVLALAALVAVGFFGYRYWERYDTERRATEVIGEARMLSSRLRSPEVPEGLKAELEKAAAHLAQASSHLARGDYSLALGRGRESLALFESILDVIGGERPGIGEAQFLWVDGRVEYRRGDGGDWQDARSRVALYSGDHVKTGTNGSTEIVFLDDGTLYVARPNTQFILSRTHSPGGVPEQSIQMDYGWVNLNTNERGGTVSTPEAEARVAGDSEGAVTYDAATKSGRFAAFRGAMEVWSAGGEERQIGALEAVAQTGGRLTGPKALLPPPRLEAPEDNLELDAGGRSELVLAWQPVEGAESYALQVSRSHLFADNVIDVEGRSQPRATLGIRGEGVFQWRVAATGSGGETGPWSPPRRFRISAVTREEIGERREPPPLAVDEIESYGSIFIVSGRTEPGLSLTIEREPVQVEADGGFTKTIQITKEGWSFIEIRARDGEGNETVLNPRVFVEVL